MLEFQKGKYIVNFKKHALIRAIQRGIDIDLIGKTIQTGEMKRFGDNRILFVKKFNEFVIRCVDEQTENEIKIVTITINWA